MGSASYVIGLGSNRPHGRHGPPERVIRAAIVAMAADGLTVRRISRTLRTPAMGPSDRDFANAAVLVESHLPPPALLASLQRIERGFGRRRYRRWGARVLDLDILAWSGGDWVSRGLAIPHIGLGTRYFALGPAAEIAPGLRHPRHNRTLRQLHARLRKPHPVDRAPRTP
ncbi:2-amino-4-hydroxy-6-hydroxymethyldihydropteridine diphosphokinase [Nostoc sp. 3335mG]|nr:2-amino-4-hydroxy-6-hydroxymethyldihydropteridine diphosphokinase [Nostoc sp. 3335mG]